MRTVSLLLLFVLACDDAPLPDGSTSTGSTSTGEDSVTETPAESSTSGSSTGEPSTGEGFMTEAEQQPSSPIFWGSCATNDDCKDGAYYCLQYPAAPDGVCTAECQSVADCFEPPLSGAVLACGQISPGSNLFCLLTCDAQSDCPGGMFCAQLPDAGEDAAIQKVCL